MNISYNWLKDYINFEESPQKIAEILTDLGLEIGGIEKKESIKGGLEGFVVGKVLSCEKHPDADKLKLTKVDTGSGTPLNIVCGAPNVATDQHVIVATIGTTLYNGEESFKIKKSKIRGELSEGMLCGEDEIGVGTSNEGIINLSENIIPGTLAKDYYKVTTDYILEVDITPNRADALSHIGVARDLAAYFKVHGKNKECNVILPELREIPKSKNERKINIEVLDKNACPKYCGISIDNVVVQQSPEWIQTKIKSIGLKPINNIVDITNFVLMETGQSLHAFDTDVIGNDIKISKDFAEKNLRLLDDSEIILSADDLVISNNNEAHCLAGVMGGLKSGVVSKTKNIFLEAAYFNPVDVRKSSKRHNVKSDSSYRFERGLDPNNTELALKRAVNLILEIAGGTVSSDLQVIQSKEFNDFKVVFRVDHCNKVLGTNLSKTEICTILAALEIKIIEINENELSLEIPQYRVDVQRECDVIEEILRVYGYNNVQNPSNLNSSIVYSDSLPQEKFQQIISNTLSDKGFNEILCNSLTKPDFYEGIDCYDSEQHVELLNPLSTDLSILRRSLLFGGLESIQRNQNMKTSDLKLYEIGKTYKKDGEGKYNEEKHLSLFISGNINQHHWNTPSKKSSFFDLKGYVNLITERIGAKNLKIKAGSNPLLTETVCVFQKKNLIAEYGQVKPTISKKMGIKQPVYFANFNWSALLTIARSTKITYTELSKFHPVKRDLSLLLNSDCTYKELENLAYEAEKDLLNEVELFDVYQGDKLPENKKSYALSFQLQSQEGTLNEKQIEKVMRKLISTFENKLGAQLR